MINNKNYTKINYTIRDGKLHYDINREAATISTLVSGIIQVKKYYLLMKVKWQNKPNSHILFLTKGFEK